MNDDADQPVVTTLTITPLSATKQTLEQHCVTATPKDSAGIALPDIPLDFNVSGVNPATGAATTNASGTAQFCFNGANAGSDTITARFMTRVATATITWTKRTTALTAKPLALSALSGSLLMLQLRMEAQLTHAGSGVSGKPIVFVAGTQTCTATTNAAGTAVCNLTIARLLAGTLSLEYNANFAGDAAYLPSTARGPLLQVLGIPLF